MSAPAVLFIGLDSMEPTLMLRWAAEGRMPALHRLMANGRVGVGTAPVGLGSDATWSCFNAGLNAGRTGRYFIRQVKPGTYQSIAMTAGDVHGEPFWMWASRAGRRVATIDMPYAAVQPLNGVAVADWLAHGPLYGRVPHSYPAALASEVVSAFGPDPIGSSDRPGKRTPRELAALAEGLIAKTKQKTSFALSLLGSGSWDLFCVTYTDVHCAGHQLWHIHDPASATDDRAAADLLGDLLLAVYEETDAALGELLAAVGPETTVVTFTGPGMGPNHTGSHILDDVLRRLEPGAVTPKRLVMDPLRSTYRRVVPWGIRSRLRDRADGLDEASLAPTRRRRRFYAVPSNESAGAIRVNLVGRDPQGLVQRGADFDRMFDELRDELLALSNAVTGNPVVKDVVRADALYSGDYLDWLPDILVVWTQAEPVVGVRSPRIGEVWREYPGQRTGDHTPEFLFLARGPGVVPGTLSNLDPLSFAPAISQLLDVAPPEAIDGTANAELVGRGVA